MAPDTIDVSYARTIAAVLLAFLDSLPESVVPPSLHQRCCEVTNRDAAFEVRKCYAYRGDILTCMLDAICFPSFFRQRESCAFTYWRVRGADIDVWTWTADRSGSL